MLKNTLSTCPTSVQQRRAEDTDGSSQAKDGKYGKTKIVECSSKAIAREVTGGCGIWYEAGITLKGMGQFDSRGRELTHKLVGVLVDPQKL